MKQNGYHGILNSDRSYLLNLFFFFFFWNISHALFLSPLHTEPRYSPRPHLSKTTLLYFPSKPPFPSHLTRHARMSAQPREPSASVHQLSLMMVRPAVSRGQSGVGVVATLVVVVLDVQFVQLAEVDAQRAAAVVDVLAVQ